MSSLQRLLARQGFTGPVASAREFNVFYKRLGTFTCNGKPLQVIFHGYEETRPAGHGTYRLIFLDGSVYLGFYLVADEPNFKGGSVIEFPYPADMGNKITCDAKGLPKTAWLNGAIPELDK